MSEHEINFSSENRLSSYEYKSCKKLQLGKGGRRGGRGEGGEEGGGGEEV